MARTTRIADTARTPASTRSLATALALGALLVFFGAPLGCDGDDGECDDTGDCGAPCEVDGVTYMPGDSVPGSCGSCICEGSGQLACPDVECPDCTGTDGEPHYFGETWQEACNTCECAEDGTAACTLIACASCSYGGQEYQEGESFPALDGCNTCTCDAGGMVVCTELACACDPESEWWRDYVGSSPEECAVIDYDCPGTTTAFSNDCGCGCEQDASCPEVFDCKPPNECDLEMIEADCPYSTVAL